MFDKAFLFYFSAVFCFTIAFWYELSSWYQSVTNFTFVNQFFLSPVSARLKEDNEISPAAQELVPFPLQMTEVNGPESLHRVVKR